LRIRSKFLLSFLALSLVPLVFVGVLAFRSGRRAIERSLGRGFEDRAAQAIESLDRDLAALSRSAQSWTGLDLMQDVVSQDLDGRISSFLIEQSRRQPHLVQALVAMPDGLVVAASRPEWVGQRVAVGPTWMEERCADEGPLGRGTPASLSCGHLLRALFDENRVIGVLLVTWHVGVRSLPSGAGEEGGFGQGELVLLRRDGLVVTAPASHREWEGALNLVQAGARAAALARAGRRGHLVEPLLGRDHLVGFARSQGISGWSALVLEEAASAFTPVYRLRAMVLGVGAAVALLAVALSALATRRTARPVLEVAAAAQRVAAGDLEARVPPRTRDEIGELAASFNRMAEDLQRQRAQLVARRYVDSILASMADGLLVVDPAGTAERGNRALLEMLALAETDLPGRRAGSLFREGEATFAARVTAPVLAGLTVREAELTLAAGDVPVSVSAGPILGADGRVEAVVCIVTDMRQHKEVEAALVQAREQAEAATRAREEFLATVSHEIRTPLNGVIGMTELLAGTVLTQEQRGWVEAARRSGEALLAIVNDILDFSKANAGEVVLELLEFDLVALVEAAGDILALRAREKGIDLAVLADPALPSHVRGDPARLRQVLLNLGTNAVKFTLRGEIVLRVEPEPSGGGRVRFSVTDTGIGIPADRHHRLFQPFSQTDPSTTRRFGGTGLGLAISKRIVETMGGQIGFTSREGEGSTFWVSVPLPAAAWPAGETPARRRALGGLRVLVVDDNATNREVLRGILRSWGCSAVEAGDAWEALEEARSVAGTPRRFDLALIDFQMPEMDGGQLAAEMKKDPTLADIPLILLTSVPQQGDAARVLGLGFAAYLTKPIKQAVLAEAVEAVVAGRGQGPAAPRLRLVTAYTLRPPGARRRALVVDRAEDAAALTLRALDEMGFAGEAVATPPQGGRAAARTPYDLVLVDCDPPGEAALQLARRLAEGPGAPRVVGLSASPGADAAERCRAAGIHGPLRKPVRVEDLRAVLEGQPGEPAGVAPDPPTG
jgi:PAS domain S-box-containing protein